MSVIRLHYNLVVPEPMLILIKKVNILTSYRSGERLLHVQFQHMCMNLCMH